MGQRNLFDKIQKISGDALKCFKLTQGGWLDNGITSFGLCLTTFAFTSMSFPFSIDFTPTSPWGDHKVVAYDVTCAQGPNIAYHGGS